MDSGLRQPLTVSGINVGSISAIATTTLELHVGFWSAYLLPLLMFGVGFFVLVSGRKRYVIKPPQGGVIGNCFKALWIAARNRFDLDAAKPSLQLPGHKRYTISWDDSFVDELKKSLVACKVFLFFPIYWLTYSYVIPQCKKRLGFATWLANAHAQVIKRPLAKFG
jgi:dipeptide/tripeptide permease